MLRCSSYKFRHVFGRFHVESGGPGLFRVCLHHLTGTAPIAASSTKEIRFNREPGALLKTFRPDNDNKKNSLNANGNCNGVESEKLHGEGGGRTDVQLINSVSEIEQILAAAGGEQEISPAEGDSCGDAAQPLRQMQQLSPQLSSHFPDRIDGSRFVPGFARNDDVSREGNEQRGDVRHDTSTQKAAETRAEHTANEPPAAAPFADCSDWFTEPAATEVMEGTKKLQICSTNAGVVQRPRPWAVQRFIRPKRPLAW